MCATGFTHFALRSQQTYAIGNTEQHCNPVDAVPGLEPCTAAQLHQNTLHLRAFYYKQHPTATAPTPLPTLPPCLLLCDAFSKCEYLFLFVSITPGAEIATQEITC